MSEYIVYMHVNKVNGKKYVGITKNATKRWRNGNGYCRNKHFFDAIKKYGWDGFAHLVMRIKMTLQEALKEEERLIALYRTQDKERGYNLSSGGEHPTQGEETRLLMSKNRMGKGRCKRSEETRRLMSINHGGGTECAPVMCVENGAIYESINAASRATGINKKGISGCCRGVKHYNTAGGYHWEFMNEG